MGCYNHVCGHRDYEPEKLQELKHNTDLEPVLIVWPSVCVCVCVYTYVYMYVCMYLYIQ